MQPSEEPGRVEVQVMGVYMHQEEGSQPALHFVLLKDEKKRRMPLWVGQFEAWAISYALEGDPPERPTTHDLTLHLLQAAGATVTEAAITDLRDETFYAILTLSVGTETRAVDARPSDAIALALRARAPLYVAEAVIAATARE